MELRRFARRAALRGSLAAGLTMAIARASRRTGARPSVVAAATGSFAAGAALELPGAALPGALAVIVAARRASRDGHVAPVIAASTVGGVAVAVATRHSWPVAPTEPAAVADRRRVSLDPMPAGRGITIVVNPNAGPARATSPAEQLRDALPEADIVEVDDPSQLPKVLEDAVAAAYAIGVAGGDGSINAAASIAAAASKPLVVIPGGTLNHLARDLGLESVDDAIDAVRAGEAMEIDLPTIDGRPFVNTASFGSYADLVDAREALEDRIGKWPAMVVALVRVLRTSEPCDVAIDGRRRRIWMAFIGNCRYHPSGFAPSWRERLDDGMLDVRLVDATAPLARVRLVLALLTGRLGRTAIYEQVQTKRLEVRSLDRSLRLACDGETFDGAERFTAEKTDARLVVYVPARD